MRYILFLLTLLFSSISFTQDSSESVDSGNIEEVVTSALRKETELQDTALAITVVSSEDIESKNLKEFYDFQFNVPGVAFQKENFAGAGVQIRGMQSYAIGGSFSGIATYRQDDAGVGGLQMAFNELFDIAAFEVLRGPQGTLFGGNNPGGTFIINSRDPGDETDGYLKWESGDLNLQRVSGGFTINPGNDVRTRVSFRSLNRDGYITNTLTGNDIDNRKSLGVRVKTIADISDDTSLTFTVIANNEDDARMRTGASACAKNLILGCDQWGDGLQDKGAPFSGITTFSAVDYLLLNYAGDYIMPDLTIDNTADSIFYEERDKVYAPVNPRQERRDITGTLKLEHQLDAGLVEFIAAFNQQSYKHAQSLNAFAPSVGFRMGPVVADLGEYGMQSYDRDTVVDMSEFDYNTNTYELRFISDNDGPLNYTSGLFHSLYDFMTHYTVANPALEYYGYAGAGPIGRMHPDLADYGGLNFWATYFVGYTGALEEEITNATIAAAVGYVGADPTTPAQIGALIPQLLAAGACTNPATDCLALAQQVLVGNAAALPQIQMAGVVNGVGASHNVAANSVRGLAAAVPGAISPALPKWQRNFQSWNKGYRDTWGVFTEANYEVDDVTNLTAGIRFNKADIVDAVMSGITDLTLLGGYNGALQGYPVVPEGTTSLDEWTGRLILDRKLADGNLIYVKYDRGLKSGGFNPTFAQSTTGSTDATLGLVDPEIHNVFEVGSKGRYLGGALTVNAAAYLNSVAGMQLQKIVGLSSQTFNSDVDIQGFELEMLFIPNEYTRLSFVGAFATSELAGYSDYDPRNPYDVSQVLTDPVDVGAGTLMAVTDVGPIFSNFGSQCKEYFNTLLSIPCTSAPVLQDLTGKRLPGVPEVTYSISGEFDLINNSSGRLTLAADYAYRSEFYLTPFNNSHERVDGFNFTNVDLSWTSASGTWAVDFYVHNIEDKEIKVGGFVGASSNGGNTNVWYMEPMNGGLSIIYNF
jgi:outer membrane receptor protein involved in Fe transport